MHHRHRFRRRADFLVAVISPQSGALLTKTKLAVPQRSTKFISVTSSSANSPATDIDSASKSLYQRFLDLRDDVLRHKWLMSEEAGEDVGFEAALIDWLENQPDDEKASADAK